MKRVFLAVFMTVTALAAFAQPTIVGEHVPYLIETQHPYTTAKSDEPTLTRSDTVNYPGATYIAVHFASFQLGPGDFVIVRSPDHKQVWRYTDLGRGGYGMDPNGFFATHIKGDEAIIELWTTKGEAGYGYDVDFFGRGYSNEEIKAFWEAGLGEEMNLPEPHDHNRSICTTDDSREAKCYQFTEPDAYDKSRAVARLLLNGSAWCTGWLIGCDGHIMTNEHCIGSQADANNIDFEFMAEGADCSTNCASSLACSGTIEASGGTLVAFDAALDYAMVLADTSVANNTDLPATYGYMRLRESGAVLNERLYIPQHPAGWGKRIAMESSYPGDPDGFARVSSTNEVGCSGGPGDIGYWADTQGGSSGSPVLGYDDNLVIALHHCRGSASCASGNPSSDDPNRGVPIEAVISSLGANLPNCATCTPPGAPSGVSAANNGNNQIDVTWSSVGGASSYNVYRAVGACPQGSYSLVASSLAGTAYSDTDVSGGVTYAYVVTAISNNCESDESACASETATGACTAPPTFGGLAGVTDLQQTSCALQLDWAAGSANCGSSVSYNVYRSTTSGFTPGPGNLIASCLGGTTYTDTDVTYGATYYYVVRAEDNSGGGSGPCGSGIEDGNLAELGGSPNGPGAFSDDMESGAGQWNVVSLAGSGPWALDTAQSNSPATSWFVADPSSITDQAVETASDINVIAGATLEFYHWYNTESGFDGGVLEYSTNGGSSWSDIGSANILQNGYNSTISTSYSNPLAGRSAWSGNSGGFVQTVVDISSLAGSSVRFRFRFASDTSVSATGWWVDDVLVTGNTCTTGGGCTYGTSPGSANYGDAGGSGSISVTAGTGCAWTAVSNDAWITITSGASGSGNGSTGYSVAANTGAARSGSITVAGDTFTVTQDAAPAGWVTLSSTDFESGWGPYTDGGTDCRRSANDSAYAHQGTFCVRLRDDTGITSSFYSTNNSDLTSYSQLRISFWVQPVSMEGSEDFFLEYSSDGGSTWQVIGNWVNNVDFTNNNFINPSVTINSGSHTFNNQAKIRFRCDASGNGDRLYFDEILVEAQ